MTRDTDRDLYFEEVGGRPFTDWKQCFNHLEQRTKRYAERARNTIITIRGWLMTDGRIPGPLAGETFRQLDLKTSQLDSVGTLDFRRALCVFVRLGAATTAFNIIPPPVTQGQCVHMALCLQQDATGGRLATYSSNLLFPDDTPPDLTGAAAESVCVIHGIADGTRGVIRVSGIVTYSA